MYVRPIWCLFQPYLQLRVTQEDGASPEGVTETVVPASEVPHGLSPSMAESARAVFAAFMWHEGTVFGLNTVPHYTLPSLYLKTTIFLFSAKLAEEYFLISQDILILNNKRCSKL